MKRLPLILFTVIFINSCEKSGNVPFPDLDTSSLEASISTFGWDLFINTFDDQENSLLSPLSIHTAMTMALMGANGQTLEKMQEALHVPELSKSELRDGYTKLRHTMLSNHDATFLSTNNALFLDPHRVDLFQEFLQDVEMGFSHEMEELDFDDPNAVDAINQWAAMVTNDRIKEVLEEIDNEEILFIINALYFLGDWELGFALETTQKQDFTNFDNSVSRVDMMFSDDNRPFYIGDGYSALDMDFKGGEYAMTFIVPDNDFSSFIHQFDSKGWYAYYKNLIDDKISTGRVLTSLPKFQLTTKYHLKEHLINMGMSHTFENADFTRMGTSPLGRIFLSRVIHDAFLKVDEKGVEGAAVTTVGVSATSLPPVIKFEKPFLYVIRHKETGIPVFLGAVKKL